MEKRDLQVPKAKNNPESAKRIFWGIRVFVRMREDGPEIARRVERVGALPHAPLVGNLPEFAFSRVSIFHLWAHCAPANFFHEIYYTIAPLW